MTELDTTRAPRGVLAAQALVDAVAEQGDLAERHYLELKSSLDLSSKKDKEKIAKFILGAANRMPEIAATAFEGYGVMIIGVAKGAITGILPVEMMEISKVIQQYLGAAGPRWDIMWLPIEQSSKQVLVILVDPPMFGQGPFPCRASGESLTDGRIYIRADGETREAKSGEIDLLAKRGQIALAIEVDIGVEILGEIAPFAIDQARTVDEYIGSVNERLIAALPEERPDFPTAAAALKGSPGVSTQYGLGLNGVSQFAGLMAEPERRSKGEYLDSIVHWEHSFRAAWSEAESKIAGSQLMPAVIKVTNRTTTFFHDVRMTLHLEGDVFALEYSDPQWADDFSDLSLPHPPRKWGPTQRSFENLNYTALSAPYFPSTSNYVPPSISYKNGGSVDFDLDIGELRPRGTYQSEDEELVLVLADRSQTAVRGTWELTARDHNDVYTGEIEVPVAAVRDLTGVARQVLGLDPTPNDEAEE